MSKNTNTLVAISLDQAQQWVGNWVNDEGHTQSPPNYVRSFLVHKDDFMDALAEVKDGNQANYLRLYIAQSTEKYDPQNLHLIVAAAYGPEEAPGEAKDFVQKGDPNVGDYTLYDFTYPCPSTCDEGSALYVEANQ